MRQHGECKNSDSGWQKQTMKPQSDPTLLETDGCTLQAPKDFISLKINVKFTEKLSVVLLLTLGTLSIYSFVEK